MTDSNFQKILWVPVSLPMARLTASEMETFEQLCLAHGLFLADAPPDRPPAVAITVKSPADAHERVNLYPHERDRILEAAISAAHDVAVRYLDDPKQAADEVVAACLGAVVTLNRRCTSL